MFKYFTEVGDDGEVSIALNTRKIFCAIPGDKPGTTILRLENGSWFTVSGNQLEIVAQLNERN